MKRILSLVLILILSVGVLTACQLPGNLQVWLDNLTGNTTTTTTPVEPPEPEHECKYNLGAAKDYVNTLYISWLDDNSVLQDFDVATLVPVGAQRYTVSWTTDHEGVTIVTKDEVTATVKIPALGVNDNHFTLTATITAPDGCSDTITYELKVPALKYLTFDEYIAAEDGDIVTITGIVTVGHSKAENSNCYNELFLQDLNGNGGYYVYSMADGADPVKDLGIKTGMTVMVSGTKAIYNGTHEIKNAVVQIVDSTIKEPTVFDLTDKFTNANDATDATLTNYLGCLVTIKNVVIGGNDNKPDGTANKYYYYFTLDGLTTYIRLSLSCGLPEADVKSIQDQHKAHYGWTADITGLVNVYNGSFYIVPVDVNAIDYKSEPTCEHTGGTATCVKKAVCDLCGLEYGEFADHVGGTATCTTYASCTVCGEKHGKLGAHAFTDGVCSCGVTNVLSTETEYYLGMYQGNKADVYYFIGEMVNNYYYGTSTEAADAVKVKLEAVEGVEGAYHITFTVDGAKKYLSVVERSDKAGSATITIEDTVPANYFTYNTEYNTFVTTFEGQAGEVSFFLGNYNQNTSLSGSATKYLAEGNFVAALYVIKEDEGGNEGGNEGGDDTTTPEDGVYTIPQVLAAAEGTSVVVKGTVKSFYYAWDESYGNCSVYIVDEDGNELLCFRLATKVEIGDQITVTGNVAVYNGVNQLGQGCTAVIDVPAGDNDGDDTTDVITTIPDALAANDGVAVKLTGVVVSADSWNTQFNNMSVTIKDTDGNTIYVFRLATQVGLGDTITLEGFVGSYNGSKQIAQGATATIDVVHGDNHTYENGQCTVCGATKPVEGTTTITVSISDYAAANGWTNGTQYPSITMDDSITVTAKGSSNTGKYYTSGTNWRLYQTESPSLTITAAEGKTILSVKITYVANNTGCLTLDGANVATDVLITVNGNSVTFGVGNTGSATNGQVRITSIEVIYQ